MVDILDTSAHPAPPGKALMVQHEVKQPGTKVIGHDWDKYVSPAVWGDYDKLPSSVTTSKHLAFTVPRRTCNR